MFGGVFAQRPLLHCLSREHPCKPPTYRSVHDQFKTASGAEFRTWHPWRPMVENSRLFAQRTVRPLWYGGISHGFQSHPAPLGSQSKAQQFDGQKQAFHKHTPAGLSLFSHRERAWVLVTLFPRLVLPRARLWFGGGRGATTQLMLQT